MEPSHAARHVDKILAVLHAQILVNSPPILLRALNPNRQANEASIMGHIYAIARPARRLHKSPSNRQEPLKLLSDSCLGRERRILFQF